MLVGSLDVMAASREPKQAIPCPHRQETSLFANTNPPKRVASRATKAKARDGAKAPVRRSAKKR